MSEPAALAALVPRLAGARVLVIGDVMLDRYVYGDVERISPEAPIPVLRIARESAMLGGAGNVARNLAALGAAPHVFGVIGDDDAGRELAGLFRRDRIEAHLEVEPGRRTTVKTRYIAGGQQLLRADLETDASPSRAAALIAAMRGAFDRAGAAILSDYGKGAAGRDVARAAIEEARAKSVPVIVDPKGADWSAYRGAAVVTPNRRELAEASRMATDGDGAIAAAAQHLIEAHRLGHVLVTRGAEGMTLVGPDGAVHLSAEAREVFDVSGAGDTVVAVVAAAVAEGIDLESAARLANAAAGIVVGRSGTAVAHADEIVAALTEGQARKFATRAEAIERAADWRRRGLRIGFTNGCFDLIHPGHVSLLSQARAACDKLIVGLNSDASVARLKGEGRPVQNAESRAAVLGSLATVDLVVLFGDEARENDTPVALIEAIRPDVLVKGADYSLDQVVGADIVKSYGGRVLLAELAPGHSTTATIARLAR